MKIFLSYASPDRAIAQSINRALLDQGHDVFFDREDLSPGEEFHIQIRRAIEAADLFVFLISEHAIDAGSYTLNELEIAEKKLKQASGRLLPVLLQPISLDTLPAFVKSVTLLQSTGNIPAAVADAVHRVALKRRRGLLWKFGGGTLAVALIGVGVWFARATGARGLLDYPAYITRLVRARDGGAGADNRWQRWRTVGVGVGRKFHYGRRRRIATARALSRCFLHGSL